MKRSKCDPIQIQQITFDEELEAMRVHVLPTEMEFDIHEMEVHECKASDILDTHKFNKMNIISADPVEIKMIILSQEVSLGNKLGISEICSPAIKVMSDCIIVLQN